MFVIRLLLLPIRLAFGTSRVATKVGYRAGRLLGYRRIFVLGTGIGIGLLLAPTSGRELRRRIAEAVGGPSGVVLDDSGDLAEHVRHHLRQAPRTWHLPQPVVTEVAPGRIRLDGAVADDTARRDLEATTAQVTGVADIDNQVRLGG
jgi:hypothetical protein